MRPVWPFALLAALLLVLIWVAAASPVHVIGQPYRTMGDVDPDDETTAPQIAPTYQAPARPRDPVGSDWVAWVVYAGGAAAAILGLALLVRWLLVRRRAPRPGAPPPAPDAADEVLADAQEQLAVLDRGPAGSAIIACWQRLEEAIARSGTPAESWETSAEVTDRVLRRYAVDPTALTELGELYREARFSTHVLGEPERRRATEALEVVHTGLAQAQAQAHGLQDRHPAGGGSG